MKYIDAEKLIKAIEEKGLDCSFALKMERLDTLALIDELQQEQIDMGEVSDGYHTFNELYYYRMLYNAAFFNLLPKGMVHKSKRHHSGEECFGGGWFIVMANLPTGQISNHYELKDWDLFQIPEKEFADEWDGHSPQEAAERLYKYLQQEQPDVHYTKRNEIFDKCVENCDPKVMKEVSDNVDKLKSISTPAEEDWFKISEEWEKEDEKSVTDCDELKEAARKYARKIEDVNPASEAWDFEGAFRAGAQYASPRWISVDERLPDMDEEVIVLIDELGTAPFYKIAFGHIVNKERCLDYNGWNIPGVKFWMLCPTIPKEK